MAPATQGATQETSPPQRLALGLPASDLGEMLSKSSRVIISYGSRATKLSYLVRVLNLTFGTWLCTIDAGINID